MEYGAPLGVDRRKAVESFLLNHQLTYDPRVQLTVNVLEDGEIAATGSIDGALLKCIAVSARFQGEGLGAVVVSELVKAAYEKGLRHLFLFTKPPNKKMFGGLGFYPVAETPDVLLMENKKNGVADFVVEIRKIREAAKPTGTIGAIVANCNPFTNGHLYLAETASKSCGAVHFFVLSEERSCFSADWRLDTVRRGTAHLKNVIVHPTGPYLISAATFPDYFLKEKTSASKVHCELDLAVFCSCFARPLEITRRFVGSEPLDPLTAQYNDKMKAFLPKQGVTVEELSRKTLDGQPVSASRVRRLLGEGKLEAVRSLVPPATYEKLERMSFHDLL